MKIVTILGVKFHFLPLSLTCKMYYGSKPMDKIVKELNDA